MTDVDMLRSLIEHIERHDLQGTAMNVAMVHVLRVSLPSTPGSRDGTGRMLLWAQSIGATETQLGDGKLIAEGTLDDGTAVRVDMMVRPPESETVTVPLHSLGEVAS